MKEITLTFNNTTTTLTSDEEGRYNLNDLHRLSGYSASKRPGNWKAYAVDIINEYSNARILAIETKRGNGGGTWAIEPLVYVYASYLSADFHKAVLDAFTAAVNGNGKKAVKKAQSVARVKSKEARIDMTKEASKWCDNVWTMRHVTDKVSKAGIPALQIRRGNTAKRGTWAIEEFLSRQIWRVNAQTTAFINEISMDGIPSFKITRGKIGGTWAHPDIALAYTAVIDIIHQF